MSDEATSSTIPGIAPLTNYRDWVGNQSRGARVGILLGVFVVFVVFGNAIDALNGAIGSLPTQVLTWIVFLAMLYTVYALVRSLVK